MRRDEVEQPRAQRPRLELLRQRGGVEAVRVPRHAAHFQTSVHEDLVDEKVGRLFHEDEVARLTERTDTELETVAYAVGRQKPILEDW